MVTRKKGKTVSKTKRKRKYPIERPYKVFDRVGGGGVMRSSFSSRKNAEAWVKKHGLKNVHIYTGSLSASRNETTGLWDVDKKE